MTDRQNLILFAVVQEYIKNAQPVGSRLVFEKYNFNISPATFRNEFAELEESGYLYQPHTSSGRVPTDKGYRLFVNYLLEKRKAEKEKMNRVFSNILKAKKEQDEVFAELARSISDISQNVAFSGHLGSKMFFKSGINEVMSQPEFNDASLRRDFGNIVDSFEDNLYKMVDKLPEDKFLILIGQENPFKEARGFSMMISKCNFSGHEGIVAILGQKRMNYERNINLINSLKSLLQ